jgi:hypothetical protein
MKIYLFFITIILYAIHVNSNPLKVFNTMGEAGLTAFEWMAEKFD